MLSSGLRLQTAGVVMEKALDEKLQEIRGNFEFFDRDNNGLIDFDEF